MAEVPGLKWVPKPTVMDMSYDKNFTDAYVGDAYERMFLNAALGDQSLFVSADELVEMWRIFTPLLHQIDEQKPKIVLYPFGMVPPGWAEWATARGAAPKPTLLEFLVDNKKEDLRKIFDEFDVDSKGLLEGSELLKLAKRFNDGREPTTKQFAAIMDRIDASGSGSVTWDEFVQAAGVISSVFRAPVECQGWFDDKDLVKIAASPKRSARRADGILAEEVPQLSLSSSMDALRFDPAMPFSVIIFGATGDLARKKLFPALYQARSP